MKIAELYVIECPKVYVWCCVEENNWSFVWRAQGATNFPKKFSQKLTLLILPNDTKITTMIPLIDEYYCWLWCIFCCFTLWQQWGTKNSTFISIRGIPPQNQKKSQNSQKYENNLYWLFWKIICMQLLLVFLDAILKYKKLKFFINFPIFLPNFIIKEN